MAGSSDVAQFHVGDHNVGSPSSGDAEHAIDVYLGDRSSAKHPESAGRADRPMPRALAAMEIGFLFQGFGLGGFAEQALIHENQLALVPKVLPFAQAALLRLRGRSGVAGSVLNTANVSAGDTVVIFGAGGVGLNAVSGARIAGASKNRCHRHPREKRLEEDEAIWCHRCHRFHKDESLAEAKSVICFGGAPITSSTS